MHAVIHIYIYNLTCIHTCKKKKKKKRERERETDRQT